MILDTEIQTRPLSEWQQHTGPDIGANAPTAYGMFSAPGSSTAMLFYTVGAAAGTYTDWLAGLLRPILPNTGHLQLDFDLITNQNAMQFAECIEVDTVISIGGYNMLCGFQIVYADNGAIQISDAASGWQAEFPGPGKLSPNTPHHFTFKYSFNATSHVYSFESIVIDGKSYPIPASQQNLTGVQAGWAEGAILQVQLDTNGQGGGFAIQVDHVNYTWS